MVEESSTVNPKVLSPETHNRKSNNYLAIKLNRLKDKQVRFESHKEFLSRCITDGLVPKGLELMLEPTIGNHDQNFLDNWYSKLKQFSLSLMKDIVQFCDKTIDATTTEINTTESSLKSNTNQEKFKVIQSEIKSNEAATRKILQQRKFKKFNTLKYKPNATTQPLTQKEDGIQEKPRNPLYSDILKRKKSNTNLKRKTSESNTLANKPTTVEQLKTLNINNKGKSPSRSTSSTNQGQEESLKQQIKQLQQEVRNLKGNSNINETNNNSLFKEPKQQPTHSKNAEMASNNNGGQQQNMEIINMISYIEQTTKTLKNFGEQLKIQLDTNLIQ